MKYCKCGCGERISDTDREGRSHSYKPGHQSKRENHWHWNGGKCVSSGYRWIRLPTHRDANSHGYVREHRVIFENTNKCCLLDWAIVHHKDGNRLNNDPYNLEAMVRRMHPILHTPSNNTKKMMSESHKRLWGLRGGHHSQESREKMRLAWVDRRMRTKASS